MPAVRDCILLAAVYSRDLAQVADRCFTMLLIAGVSFLGDAIWGERMPPSPSVPERRDPGEVGGIVIEILIFVSYILFMHPRFARLASRLQQRVLGMLL